MTGERQRALAALRRAGGWTSAADVAKDVGKKVDATRKMLDRMAHEGDGVEKQIGKGLYRATPDQGRMTLDEGQSTTAHDEEEDPF